MIAALTSRSPSGASAPSSEVPAARMGGASSEALHSSSPARVGCPWGSYWVEKRASGYSAIVPSASSSQAADNSPAWLSAPGAPAASAMSSPPSEAGRAMWRRTAAAPVGSEAQRVRCPSYLSVPDPESRTVALHDAPSGTEPSAANPWEASGEGAGRGFSSASAEPPSASSERVADFPLVSIAVLAGATTPSRSSSPPREPAMSQPRPAAPLSGSQNPQTTAPLIPRRDAADPEVEQAHHHSPRGPCRRCHPVAGPPVAVPGGAHVRGPRAPRRLGGRAAASPGPSASARSPRRRR